jgi:hypothetical protein
METHGLPQGLPTSPDLDLLLRKVLKHDDPVSFKDVFGG